MKLFLAVSNSTDLRRTNGGKTNQALRQTNQERVLASGGDLHIRVLLSFWYFKGLNIGPVLKAVFNKPFPEVFGDSGAFSAFNMNQVIDVSEYADWLIENKAYIKSYANLDVICNVDQGLKNLHALESRGLKPIPVFHTGEPWSVLKDMTQSYPYVGLGGLTDALRMRGGLTPFLDKCFSIAGSQSVFHGFGITTLDMMKRFPWYSVDSSSWTAGVRFGTAALFDRGFGQFKRVALRDWNSIMKHEWLIKQLGGDVLSMVDTTKYITQTKDIFSAIQALGYMHCERWLTKRWGEIKIPRRKKKPGDSGVAAPYLQAVGD